MSLHQDNGGLIGCSYEDTQDPYWNYCALALPLWDNGTGSLITTDLSPNTKTITNNSITWQTNVQNFYGGGARFSGSGYLESSNSSDFIVGSGDFTLESWFNVNASQTTNPRLFGQNINSSSNWDCYIDGTSGTNGIYMHGSYTNLNMSFPSANAWHHFCIVRKSGILYSFMNGNLAYTQSYTNYVGVSNYGFRVGEIGPNGGSGYRLNGYVQDFRLYNGVAKYTSNFTPPTRSLISQARRYPSGVFAL